MLSFLVFTTFSSSFNSVLPFIKRLQLGPCFLVGHSPMVSPRGADVDDGDCSTEDAYEGYFLHI